jgi:hypothetical protein
MSKIALLLKNTGPNKVDVVSALRTALGLSLQDINYATSTGAPLIERTLFDRKDPAFAERLYALMSKLEALGASFVVYQLLDDHHFSAAEKYYEITVDRLRNLISSRGESLRQQRALGEREGGSF